MNHISKVKVSYSYIFVLSSSDLRRKKAMSPIGETVTEVIKDHLSKDEWYSLTLLSSVDPADSVPVKVRYSALIT